MKEIQLPHGRGALIDDRDFESVSRFKWYVTVKGYARTGMYMGMIGGQQQQASMKLHCLILHPPKGMEVDHINHDKLDCRRTNMRICTHRENCCNQVIRKGTSKWKGVTWYKPTAKWMAYITHNGKRIHLGLFATEEAAAMAYDAKARELFGEFAHTNFKPKDKETQ